VRSSAIPLKQESCLTLHVAIIEGDAKQEGPVNASLIYESIKVFQKQHPNIKELWFCSDNAGCYKTEAYIIALWSLRNEFPGMELKGIIFSSPCGGKSKCDSYAAITKRHMLKSLNFGYDIMTAKQMADAMTR
jgi:hypothetical protein